MINYLEMASERPLEQADKGDSVYVAHGLEIFNILYR